MQQTGKFDAAGAEIVCGRLEVRDFKYHWSTEASLAIRTGARIRVKDTVSDWNEIFESSCSSRERSVIGGFRHFASEVNKLLRDRSSGAFLGQEPLKRSRTDTFGAVHGVPLAHGEAIGSRAEGLNVVRISWIP